MYLKLRFNAKKYYKDEKRKYKQKNFTTKYIFILQFIITASKYMYVFHFGEYFCNKNRNSIMNNLLLTLIKYT